MNVIGREDETEKYNRNSLRIARKVANATGTLMAGDLSNTTIFEPNNAEAIEKVKAMFKVRHFTSTHQCNRTNYFGYFSRTHRILLLRHLLKEKKSSF